MFSMAGNPEDRIWGIAVLIGELPPAPACWVEVARQLPLAGARVAAPPGSIDQMAAPGAAVEESDDGVPRRR
jgi:hypothetical protein